MEAVPRMPMISFELKQSLEFVEYGPTLKQYIRDHYGEDPAHYNKACNELEQLRQSAVRVSHDFMGCSTLKKYFAQLQFLQVRFPMSEIGEASVPFTWEDIHSGREVTLNDIKFEQACILYNIGALHSVLGAMDTRQSADGMKVSCTHFQCGAWAFEYLRDNFGCAGMSLDMSHEILTFQTYLMLAQAQECILEKSMTDSRKNTITAKVSAQIVEFYQLALKHLETCHGQELISSKQYKEWKKRGDLKILFYTCITHYYMGRQSEEQQKWGLCLAYYTQALNKLGECQKLAKNESSDVQESLRFTNDVVGGKHQAAKKDNDFVYHEKVPALDSLPEVKGASLVKGLPFNPSDPEISGPDIFSKLVPMSAHEAASLYSEEKAMLLRRISSEIAEKNEELSNYMSSLQLDATKLNPEPERLPQQLLEKCAALSVRPNAIKDLVDSMAAVSNVSTDVDLGINEIQSLLQEESKAELEYQETFGKRSPNIILSEIAKECARLEEGHKKGSQSNNDLHKAMNTHINNLKVLSSPLEDLQNLLPSLDKERDAESEDIIKQLNSLLSKIEEMRTQRTDFEEQLRKEIMEDDITGVLCKEEGKNREVLFSEQLKKHDKNITLIKQNLSAQTNILRAMTDANAKYAKVRQATGETIMRRDQMIRDLVNSYDVYEDLMAKSQKGLEFYKKLETNVGRLLARCKGVIKVQQEEREQIMNRYKPKASQVPARPGAPKPDTPDRAPTSMPPLDPMSPAGAKGQVSAGSGVAGVPSVGGMFDGPKLKDYLPFMKPKTFGKKDGSPPISRPSPGVQDYMSQAGGSLPNSGTASPVHMPQMPGSVPASPDHFRHRVPMKQGPLDPGPSSLPQGQGHRGPDLTQGHGQYTSLPSTFEGPESAIHKTASPNQMPHSQGQGQGSHLAQGQGYTQDGPRSMPVSQSQYVPLDQKWKRDQVPGMPETPVPFSQSQRSDVPLSRMQGNTQGPQQSYYTSQPQGQGQFQPGGSSGAEHVPNFANSQYQPQFFSQANSISGQQFPAQQQPMSMQSAGHMTTEQQQGPQQKGITNTVSSIGTPVVSPGKEQHGMQEPDQTGRYQPQGQTSVQGPQALSRSQGPISAPPNQMHVQGVMPGQSQFPPQSFPQQQFQSNQYIPPQGQMAQSQGHQPMTSAGHTIPASQQGQMQFQQGLQTQHYSQPQVVGASPGPAQQSVSQHPQLPPQQQHLPQQQYPGSQTPISVNLSVSNVPSIQGSQMYQQPVSLSHQQYYQPNITLPNVQHQGQQQPVNMAPTHSAIQQPNHQMNQHLPLGYQQQGQQNPAPQNFQGYHHPTQHGQLGAGQQMNPTMAPNHQIPQAAQQPFQQQLQRPKQVASPQPGPSPHQFPQQQSQSQPPMPHHHLQQQPHSSPTHSQPGHQQGQPVQGHITAGQSGVLPTSVSRQHTPTPPLPQGNAAQGYIPAMFVGQHVSANSPVLGTGQGQPAAGQGYVNQGQMAPVHTPFSPNQGNFVQSQSLPSQGQTVQGQGQVSQGHFQGQGQGQFLQGQQYGQFGANQQNQNPGMGSVYQQRPPAPSYAESNASRQIAQPMFQGQQGFNQMTSQGQHLPVHNAPRSDVQQMGVRPPAPNVLSQQSTASTQNVQSFQGPVVNNQTSGPRYPAVNQFGNTVHPNQQNQAIGQNLFTQPPQQGTGQPLALQGQGQMTLQGQGQFHGQHGSPVLQPQILKPVVVTSSVQGQVTPTQTPVTAVASQGQQPGTSDQQQTQEGQGHFHSGHGQNEPVLHGQVQRPAVAPVVNQPSVTKTSGFMEGNLNLNPVVPSSAVKPASSGPPTPSTPVDFGPARQTPTVSKPPVSSPTHVPRPVDRQVSTASSLDEILSSSPDSKGEKSDSVLAPKVLTAQEIQQQKEDQLKNSQASLVPPKDPYKDRAKLDKFVSEVEKLAKFIEGLEKPSCSGPTPLDVIWKELMEEQDKAGRQQKLAIARCYPMKNRDQDIMPYDDSRVLLTSLKDDYINASWMNDLSPLCPKFIASQWPLPVTLIDFWLMVYEQGVEVLVALSSENEVGKKFPVYVPQEKGETVAHGPVQLTLQSIKVKPFWTERIIHLRHSETKTGRTLVHLHYNAWPVSGFPDKISHILQFITEVHCFYRQQRSLMKPVVVHCSNGVGRVGMFLLTYVGMQEINHGDGLISIPQVAGKMLWKRRNVFLKQNQVKYSYEALLYFAQDILAKQGILVHKASFGDQLPKPGVKSQSWEPGDDILFGSMSFSNLQTNIAKLGTSKVDSSKLDQKLEQLKSGGGMEEKLEKSEDELIKEMSPMEEKAPQIVMSENSLPDVVLGPGLTQDKPKGDQIGDQGDMDMLSGLGSPKKVMDIEKKQEGQGLIDDLLGDRKSTSIEDLKDSDVSMTSAGSSQSDKSKSQSVSSSPAHVSREASASPQFGGLKAGKSSSLADLQDPNTFTIGTSSGSKKKFTKSDFTEKREIQEPDPNDPLASLDPFWSLK